MTVSLRDSHRERTRNPGDTYRLYRLVGTAYDGEVVAALVVRGGRPYFGVQCLNVVKPTEQLLTGISTLTISGRAPETETAYGKYKVIPLGDEEVLALGF